MTTRAAHWLFVIGAALLALAHVPESLEALNAFDPPKRVVGWGFCVVAFLLAARGAEGGLRRTEILVAALAGWMALRAAARTDPFLEVETVTVWLALPLAWLAGARVAPWLGKPVVARVLLGCALLQGGLMLLQRFGLDPVFPSTTRAMDYAPGRMIGTLGYHNQAAEFLLVCGAALWLVRLPAISRAAGLAALGGMLALVASRGAMLAGGIAAILVALARGPDGWREGLGRRGAMAGALLLAPLLAALLLPETRGRLAEMLQDRESSPAVLSRQLMRGVATGLWREYPWVGAGPGAFAFSYLERVGTVWPESRDHDFLRVVVPAREAHCDPLHFAAEFGLVGVALAGGALAGMLAALARGRRRAPEEALAAAWLFGALGVCGLFNFTGQTAAAGPLGAFLLGWLDTALARAGGSPSVPARRSARVVALACLLVSVGALGWWGRTVALSLLLAGDGAGARVEAGLRAGPLFPRERALVGGFLARAGRWPEARAELEAAFARQREVTLCNNLGHVAFQQGRFAEARGYYRIWADSGIQHPRALANLSSSAESAGDFDGALRAVERLFRFWPGQPEGELRRVAALGLRARREAAAARILDKWIRDARAHGVEPGAETWNARGALARATRDAERAVECFRNALRLNPGLESARKNLAAMGVAAKP